TPNVYNILSPEALIVDPTAAERPQRRGLFGMLKRRSASHTDVVAPQQRSGLRKFFSRRRTASNAASEDSNHDGLIRKGSMVVEMDADTFQTQRQDMSGELQFFRDQYNVGDDCDTEFEVASVATGDHTP